VLIVSAPNDRKKRRPAFQLYAPDLLADRDFQLQSAAERGLTLTGLCECWVNGSFPANTDDMARVFRLDPSEVAKAFTERVQGRFARSGDEFICPELEQYRTKLDEHHRKKSEGGKQGARARWGNGSANGLPNDSPNGSLSREEMKGVETKGETLSGGDSTQEHKPWFDDYEGPALHEHQEDRCGRVKPGVRG